MASRNETKLMKKIASENGLRNPTLDVAGDPVIWSRTRGELKDQFYLNSPSGSNEHIAAWVHGDTTRKLKNKVAKLEELGCSLHQFGGKEATLIVPDSAIATAGKFLKIDKIKKTQSEKQLKALQDARNKRLATGGKS